MIILELCKLLNPRSFAMALLLECSLTDTDQWSTEFFFLSEFVLDTDDESLKKFFFVHFDMFFRGKKLP